MKTYRGKYPQRICTVSVGRDRIVHLYTNEGKHYTLTMDQVRSVNKTRLPNPGEEISTYVK